MGHIAGWIIPFLIFGDGSAMYLWLKKSFGIEPYIFVVLALTILGAITGGILGYKSIDITGRQGR